MNQLRPTDIASIVFSVLCAILGICMLGLAGGYLKWVEVGLGWGLVSYINFGMGSWVMLCAIIGIAAGATMNQGVYACSIVMYVFGIIGLLGSGVATILGVYLGVFGISLNSAVADYNTAVDTIEWIEALSEDQFASGLNSMPIGLISVNFLGFILMIVASCVVCCGTCCGGPTNQNQVGQSGALHVVVNQPPGYVQQPHTAQGGYGNDQYALSYYNKE